MAKIILFVFAIYMKINSINFFSYSNSSPENFNNSKSVQKLNKSVINNTFNPMEILGRSQVKFTGVNNGDLNGFDKSFLDDISKELELSEQDSHKFKKVVNQFLKNNNYASTEEFCASCDTDEKFYSFIENVAYGLNLPDEKIVILDNALMNKIMTIKLLKVLEEDESLADIIIPLTVKSTTNDLVCNNLIEKFNLTPKEKNNISSHLKRLENDISPEQIAYDITEDYKLTSIDDYNYVLRTIKSRDKMFIDFMTENDSDNNF